MSVNLSLFKFVLALFWFSLVGCLALVPWSAAHANADSISASPMQYHKVTLTWDGPNLSEADATFTDFRLNIEFTSPSGATVLVPGYFAADGDAAETSANSGNQWRAHINPQEVGTWSYVASFRTGNNIAINLDAGAGAPVANSFDGSNGTFMVTATNKSGVDFRGKGKLQYVGEHYLQFSNGEHFLKVGPNSPEAFLQYNDFDNTNSSRAYASHGSDWNTGDPHWQGTKGRELIGVVNYLSEMGMNVHYFLTMNIEGDGDEAFPFAADDNPNIFDVSKLAQWQIVFDHMMSKGIMTHFVTTETENESWFEYLADSGGGITFANTRKLYYREMVARFGYLNAITWNIGEENGWASTNRNTFGRPTTDAQRIAYAKYLDDINPYDDHLVIHNNPTVEIHSALYADGPTSYNGASYQLPIGNASGLRNRLKTIIAGSAASSPAKKWVVSYDEAFTGSRNPGVALFRENAIWNTFMLGGAGVEFYIGGGDLNVEDYREFEDYWQALDHARDFFVNNNIPFWHMGDADNLTDRGFALAEIGEVYVVYLPDGGAPKVDLAGPGSYQVLWYNPRSGGDLQDGISITEVTAGDAVSLGSPPTDADSEWVVLARRSDSVPGNIRPNVSIDSPNNAQQFLVGNTINIAASASDPDGSIANVTFLVNGSQVGAVDTLAPFQASFVASTPGNVLIQARATDNQGSARTASVSVTVSEPVMLRDPDVPSNAVTTGLDYQYFEIEGLDNLNVLNDLSGEPTLAGSQADGLSFAPRTNDNQNFGFIFSGFIDVPSDGEYSFFLNSNDGSDLRIGDTLVIDNDGQQTDEAQVTGSIGLKAGLHATQIRYFQSGGTSSLTLRWQGPGIPKAVFPASAFKVETANPPVNTPPVISLDAPTNGANIPVNSVVNVQAQASDDGSVSMVEFFVDGSLIGSSISGNPYLQTWVPTIVGNYTVSARATDNLGASTDSMLIGVTVLPDDGGEPPTENNDSICVPVKLANGTVALICL